MQKKVVKYAPGKENIATAKQSTAVDGAKPTKRLMWTAVEVISFVSVKDREGGTRSYQLPCSKILSPLRTMYVINMLLEDGTNLSESSTLKRSIHRFSFISLTIP
jgi:hypothetical protein